MSEQRVAIVTGASSGIGWHIARQFARKGHSVVLGARRQDRLEELARHCRQEGAAALVVPTDVADRSQVFALVDAAVDEFGRLDVMVNNAGYGLYSAVADIDDNDMRHMMDVNFHGLLAGCQAAARVMIPQGRGHIFNISSVLGKRGSPMHGAYCASKHAVNGLSDSLRVELAPCGVRVTCVCPGMTETDFFVKYPGGEQASSAFATLRTRMSPEKVARKVVAAEGRNVPEMVLTAGGKTLVAIASLSPRLADWMMERYRRAVTRPPQEESQ